jgi:hypothetical protein
MVTVFVFECLVFYCVHVVVKVKTKNVTCVLFTWIDIVFCEECLAYFRSFKKKKMFTFQT